MNENNLKNKMKYERVIDENGEKNVADCIFKLRCTARNSSASNASRRPILRRKRNKTNRQRRAQDQATIRSKFIIFASIEYRSHFML